MALLDGPRPSSPVRAAITSHAAWKARLQTAVTTGRVAPGTDLAATARDDVCDFGRWLLGDAKQSVEPARLTEVRSAHATFHREAAGVLQAVARGDGKDARRRLVDEDGYRGAITNLTDLLVTWAGELGV